MIKKENLKDLLKYLGYEEDKGNYIYHFKDFNCEIIVDFNNEKIISKCDD